MLMSSTALLYLSAVLIWGSTWFAIKFQLGVVAPEVSLFYRFALAALILLVFCALTARRLRYSLQEHGFIFLQGFFLFSTNYLIFYIATAYLTSGLVAVIFSSVVIMNIFNNRLFLKQPIDAVAVIASLIGITGIAFVFYKEVVGLETDAVVIKGIVLGIVATFCASLGNIVSSRNQREGLPVVQTNAFGMLYGSLLMGAYALISGQDFSFDTHWHYTVSLIYLSVLGSVFAFGAYLTLIGRIGVERAAYASVMFPLVALLISTVFEGYSWDITSVTGVVLIVVGNIIMNNKSPKLWLSRFAKYDLLIKRV